MFFFSYQAPIFCLCFLLKWSFCLSGPRPASGPEMLTRRAWGSAVWNGNCDLHRICSSFFRSTLSYISTTVVHGACKQIRKSLTEIQIILEHKLGSSLCRWHHRCAYRFQPPPQCMHTHLGAGSWWPWGSDVTFRLHASPFDPLVWQWITDVSGFSEVRPVTRWGEDSALEMDHHPFFF